MNIRIIQDILDVFERYGDGVRYDINRFEEVLNDQAPDLMDECYLIVLGMKYHIFDVMIFDEDNDYQGYIEYLKDALDLKEDEALFMISVFKNVLNEIGYYFEVPQMPQLLEEAYKSHNFHQLYVIAKAYFDGFGVVQDYEQAFKIYEYLYQHDDVRSAYYLGYMYEHGCGIEKNIEKALQYYQSGNDEQCHLRLGECYLLGIHGLYDLDKAYDHFQKSHLKDAYLYRGMMLEKKRDFSGAFQAFYQGAKMYHSECMYKVGMYLRRGLAVECHLEKARYYFQMAYYMLHGDSAYELAMMSFDGIVVEKNEKEAVHYLQQAARLDCQQTCLMLGHFYQLGQYVEIDMRKSQEYYQKAHDIQVYTQDRINQNVEEME